MAMLKKVVTISALLLSPILIWGANAKTTQDRMKGDLDFIRNTLEVHYAPLTWKRSYLGWDLDQQIDNAKKKIDAAGTGITTKDFQVIVRDFFKTMQDYHVSVQFYSTEFATLPFTIKSAGGRFFVSYVDKTRLCPTSFPIEVGDEVTIFDDQPIAKALDQILQTEFTGLNKPTDRSIAEMFLTRRLGVIGHRVPHGPIMVGFIKPGSTKVNKYQLVWDYNPEQIKNNYKTPLELDEEDVPLAESVLFKKLLMTPYFTIFKKYDNLKGENPHAIGSRKSFIPTLGPKLWETPKKNSFHAYLYDSEDGHHIGYIRIPHYLGGAEQAVEIAEILQFFEERTDALIIDQVNNPGGNLFYMCAILSMLSDQPLYNPRAKIAITQEEVALAVKLIPVFEQISSDYEAQAILGETWAGYPVTHQMSQFLLEFFRFVVREWNAGKTLTDPYYLYGIDRINPNPFATYSKPILVLVNELSFSCGDFFPAILQDNKRATIMGAKTAGAGGFVLGVNFPNRFGIAKFNYTGSIAERLNKDPIENLGVTPDIVYTPTKQDLTNNFNAYAEAIRTAVEEIIQEAKKK